MSPRRPRGILLTLLTAAVTGVACDAGNEPATAVAHQRTASAMTNAALIGTWRKTSHEACTEPYPEEIRFLEGGVYLTRIPAGEFRYWQSGDYEFDSATRLSIQTANDAMRSYQFAIDANGELTFTDEKRCEITYRRSG